jgi:hypothetical protein
LSPGQITGGKKKSPMFWETLKTKYVHGVTVTDPITQQKTILYPTVSDLSEEYGIPIATIQARRAKDKWKEAKDAVMSQVIQARQVSALSTSLSKSGEYDSKHLNQIDRLTKIVDFYFSQYEKYIEQCSSPVINDLQDLNTAESTALLSQMLSMNKPSVKDLESLIRIISQSHSLVRNIVGEPVNAEKLMKDITNSTIDTNAVSALASRLKNSNKQGA